MKKFIINIVIILLIFCNCTLFRRTPQSLNSFVSRTENYSELRYIIQSDAISRLDCAYLFAMYVPQQTMIEYSSIPLDLRVKLYSKTAYSTVVRGIMQLFPDNTFKPDEKISRYQLAIFFTRYITMVDPFFDKGMKNIIIKDVDSKFFAYKPVNTVVSRNIMELDNGQFKPYDYVSGNEAVEYFYRLSRFY